MGKDRIRLGSEIFGALQCGRMPLPLCGLALAEGITGDPTMLRSAASQDERLLLSPIGLESQFPQSAE